MNPKSALVSIYDAQLKINQPNFKNELLAYIKARGWTLHEIFEDHGKTGTNGDRPALKRLMKDARQRKFDIVCCYKLDRFFRSLSAMVALQEFSDLGIQFVSQKIKST